jgi:hypothetical protein
MEREWFPSTSVDSSCSPHARDVVETVLTTRIRA